MLVALRYRGRVKYIGTTGTSSTRTRYTVPGTTYDIIDTQPVYLVLYCCSATFPVIFDRSFRFIDSEQYRTRYTGCVSMISYVVPGTVYRVRVLLVPVVPIYFNSTDRRDLDNERTEIDSELAFGFLKMGTVPIY